MSNSSPNPLIDKRPNSMESRPSLLASQADRHGLLFSNPTLGKRKNDSNRRGQGHGEPDENNAETSYPRPQTPLESTTSLRDYPRKTSSSRHTTNEDDSDQNIIRVTSVTVPILPTAEPRITDFRSCTLIPVPPWDNGRRFCFRSLYPIVYTIP